MEQHQDSMRPKVTESYGKRLWHLWGPIIIKFGISYLASVAFSTLLMALYLVMKSGNDTQAMTELLQNQEAVQEMYSIIMKQIVDYTVLIEGVAAFVTIPVMLILFYRDRIKEKALGIVPNKKAAIWKYGAVIMIASAMCIGLNNLILISDLSAESETYEQTLEVLYSPTLAVQLICLGILTPFCEELVFRGMMFKRLRERAPFLQAALYSTLVFGFVHANIVQMLYAFAMGIMFAYVYEKYGSLKAPVIAHMIANILAVLGTHYHCFEWMMEDPMRMGAITIICAAVASTMFVLIQRIDEKPDIVEQNRENGNLAER